MTRPRAGRRPRGTDTIGGGDQIARPRPRLVDVAREAGVSVGAASDALSGKNRIPEATRRRVRDAAARLGYVPASARRVDPTPPLLGLVLGGDAADPATDADRSAARAVGWRDALGTMALAATDRGYGLAVLPGIGDRTAAPASLAGLLLLGVRDGAHALGWALGLGIPVASDAPSGSRRLAVTIDLRAGDAIDAVVAHLAELGGRSPGLLVADPEAGLPRALAAAYRAACADLAVPIREVVVDVGDGGGLDDAVERIIALGADAVIAVGIDPATLAGVVKAAGAADVAGAVKAAGAADAAGAAGAVGPSSGGASAAWSRLPLPVLWIGLGAPTAAPGVATCSLPLRELAIAAVGRLIDVVEGRVVPPTAVRAAWELAPVRRSEARGVRAPSGRRPARRP